MKRPATRSRARSDPKVAELVHDVRNITHHDAVPKPKDKQGTWWKSTKYDWIPMIDESGYEKSLVIKDVDQVRALDEKRKDMLTIARHVRPIESVIKYKLLARTVLPRIGKWKMTWFVLFSYTVSAAMTRAGVDFGDTNLSSFDSGTSIITFMLVFYVGCKATLRSNRMPSPRRTTQLPFC